MEKTHRWKQQNDGENNKKREISSIRFYGSTITNMETHDLKIFQKNLENKNERDHIDMLCFNNDDSDSESSV